MDGPVRSKNKVSAQRIASASLMIVLAVVAVVHGGFFIIFVTVLTAIGLYEFFNLIRSKNIPIYSYSGILIGILIPVSIYTRFELTRNWELLFIVLGFLAILLMQFARRDNSNAIVGISTTLFGVLYVSWFFSFLIKIRFLLPGAQGAMLLAFILLVTKSGDIGAFFIGRKFGRHPLVPLISPKKSVEGCLGGLACSALCAVMVRSFLPGQLYFSLVQIVAMGAFFGAVGQIGDLSESLIKRDCNVKDSGNVLPGMGGVLDAIDSLLFSAPAFYLYISSALNIF